MTVYDELVARGLIAQVTDEKEIKELENVSVQADEGQEHSDQTNQGKTVAFFYITSRGSANVRKPGDYVAKMITMAGGTYVPQSAEEEEENALSTMNMEMEAFYAKAKDADYIIYNSTIDALSQGEREGKRMVRLHTGDPSIYGAIREQMDRLEALGIPYETCPGVTACFGAAAALNLEYTLPGISQSR